MLFMLQVVEPKEILVIYSTINLYATVIYLRLKEGDMFFRSGMVLLAIMLAGVANAATSVKPPKILSMQKLVYPVEQLNPWQKFKVIVSFTVNVSGLPENPVITQGSGIPLLDEAVLAAVKTTTFSPALDENGKPVEFSVKQPFQLENPKPQLEQPCESLNTEISSRSAKYAKSTDMDIDFVASIQGLALVMLMKQEAMTAETIKKATKVREAFVAECKANASQSVGAALKAAFQKYKLPFI